MSAALKPDFDAQLEARIEKFREEANAWRDDPLYQPLHAIGDFMEFLKAYAAGQAALLDRAKPPTDQATIRSAMTQAMQLWAGHLVRAVNGAALVGLVIMAVLLFLGGYGARWLSEDSQRFIAIRAGNDVCEQRPDGQLCRIPVWLPKH